MSTSSEEIYLRVNDIARNPKKKGTPIINVARSTWLKWVKDGRAPAPIKLGRITVWRRSEVLAFAEGAK